jgi:hypothetical protein
VDRQADRQTTQKKNFIPDSSEFPVPAVKCVATRVARWHILITKIPIWFILEGLGMEKVSIFYGHLEYIMTVW